MINANFITGLNGPFGLVVLNNRLYVANSNGGSVGLYNATTGAAINPAFITDSLAGPSGLVLLGNRLYVFSRQGENEVMSALDPENAKVIWQTGYPASFTMNSAAVRHAAGPKSTPVFADGKLYSIGMTGVVTALDAATGKQLWQKPGSSVVPMYTTHAFSPLVDRGMVVIGHPRSFTGA